MLGYTRYIKDSEQEEATNPFGLAKRCLLGNGLMVPVDEADEADEVDEADEESSSVALRSGRGFRSSHSSSCASSASASTSPSLGGGP